MYINWPKLVFAFIYLALTIFAIFIQTTLPPTLTSLIAAFLITITTLFAALLFADSLVNAFSKPLESPNILSVLVGIVTGSILCLIQIYLFIIRLIDLLTISFFS